MLMPIGASDFLLVWVALVPIGSAVLSPGVCGAYIGAADVVVDGCPRGEEWGQWIVRLQSSVGVEGFVTACLRSFTC